MSVAMELEKEAMVNKKPPMEHHQVVVPGMGAETSLDHDLYTFYENLLQCNSGINQIENSDISEFHTVSIIILGNCLVCGFLNLPFRSVLELRERLNPFQLKAGLLQNFNKLWTSSCSIFLQLVRKL